MAGVAAQRIRQGVPVSTSAAIWSISSRTAAFSWPRAMICRLCTSGTPAESMVVIWREMTAMSIGLILAPPLENIPWPCLLTLVTLTPCLRSSALTVVMLSACNSPETFCPLRLTPCQRKEKTFFGAFCF